LGYAAGTKYTAGGGTGLIATGNRLCNGGEETIFDCPLQRAELQDCSHAHDQGVECTDIDTTTEIVVTTETFDRGAVRLTDYPRGRIEIFTGNGWGTLCGHYWWDNHKGAENICKQLGYAGGTKYTAGGGTGLIAAGNRLCNGGEATIFDCPLMRAELQDCSHTHDQGVECMETVERGSVRLTDYPKGRIEIFTGNEWGTLCGHYWWDNQKGAENICKQLGYSGGTMYTAGDGTGIIAAGNRLCNGGEKTIFDCPLMRAELQDCSHAHDQGVECTGARIQGI